MDTSVLIILFGFITLFGVCHTAEFCYNRYGDTQVCHYGCCGQYMEECCDEPFPVYLICLCIISGIIVVSVIVAVVCIFCFKKKKRGRVINPNGQIQQTSMHTTSFIVQPPGYSFHNVHQMTLPPPPSAVPPPPYYYAPTPNAHGNDPPLFNRPEGLQSQPPTGGTLPAIRPAAPSGGGLPGNHLVV